MRLLSPIVSYFNSPRYRYKFIHALSNIFTYNRKERVLRDVMGFVGFTKISGDYLEFGVWKGGSLTAAYHMSKTEGVKDMHFYAFDSFEGLPTKSGLDENTTEFAQGEYACSEQEVLSNLKKGGVDLSRVTTVKGWYSEILNDELRNRLPITKAAVVYVDCDFYESAVPVLEFVTQYINDGTVMLFDDWHCFKSDPNKGEQRAFREWLTKNPHFSASPYRSFGWMGESFIIHVKD